MPDKSRSLKELRHSARPRRTLACALLGHRWGPWSIHDGVAPHRACTRCTHLEIAEGVPGQSREAWLREQMETAEFWAWTYLAQRDWAEFARWAGLHTALSWALREGAMKSLCGQEDDNPFAEVAAVGKRMLKEDHADSP